MHPLLTPSTHAELAIVAHNLAGSGSFGSASPEQFYTKILFGSLLSLTITESLSGITVDNKRVIVEMPILIERVIARTDNCEVKVIHKEEDSCELNFFYGGKIAGQLKLTRAELESRVPPLTKQELYELTLCRGVQQYFPALFGHKFYLRYDVPLTKQDHVKAIVEQSGQKVVTADQIATTRRPGGKTALTADAKKLMDWKEKLKTLSATDAVQWDAQAEEMNTFTFLTSAQLDDLFKELCEFGRSQGVEFSSLNQHFFLADDVLAS
ncbi:hypothetical protein EXU85_20555 [Spirosoma sp. KCTC 42546]|uniref:hypothetical protein n=1 Tax=Spirosoma sp. KCTC 42546 TaxID=2520506 RepID=UPI0011599D2D|nr:hypothetical protein [Spirosoma sp. KCTC 42546]QDK80872.1 hypothetical protein EXU85_20555 [Spirosoma sp. KCTC 42546]